MATSASTTSSASRGSKASWSFFSQPGFSHVVYHPNGKQIVLASENETTIRVLKHNSSNNNGHNFDVSKGTIQEIEVDSPVTALAISKFGDYLAVALHDDRSIKIYSMISKTGLWDEVKTIGRALLPVRSLAFGENNVVAACGE